MDLYNFTMYQESQFNKQYWLRQPGSHHVQFNKSTLGNEEIRFLAKVIMKIYLFNISPHYILLILANYVYRPRLARMIQILKEKLVIRKHVVQTNERVNIDLREADLSLQASRDHLMKGFEAFLKFKFLNHYSTDLEDLKTQFQI